MQSTDGVPMTNDDEGVYQSASGERRKLRRKQAAVGVVGMAAVLGAGAYLVTTQIDDRKDSTSRDVAAPAPVVPVESPSPDVTSAPTPRPTLSTKKAAKQSFSPLPVPSESLSVDEQIQRARSAAAEDGYPVQRALTAAPGVVAQEAQDPVQVRTEDRANGSLRVITAHHDLTGRRELLWAADAGRRVGNATCTQNLHFADNATPAVRPTLMLCWRTSADRSVATILVDRGGRPSAKESARIIDREWAALG